MAFILGYLCSLNGFWPLFCLNFQSKHWDFLEYKLLLIRILKLQISVLVVFDQRKEAHTLVKNMWKAVQCQAEMIVEGYIVCKFGCIRLSVLKMLHE